MKLYSYRIHESSTSQEKRAIQTDNTLIVQRKALERMGLSDFANLRTKFRFSQKDTISIQGIF